jgi:AcrR family transcriptional regulator
VAEIAGAADVSVKTSLVYFRAKEDLALADSALLDAIIGALQARQPGSTHAEVVAAVLMAEARAQGSPVTGLEGLHRGYGQSPAVQSGLLRTLTVPEMRALAAGLTPGQAVTVLDRGLRAAARSVTPPLA